MFIVLEPTEILVVLLTKSNLNKVDHVTLLDLPYDWYYISLLDYSGLL
jgi:hypothetical protein